MDDEPPPRTAVTAGFAPGHRYAVVQEPESDGSSRWDGWMGILGARRLVTDESGHVVARLDGPAGGGVVTAAGAWTVSPERPGHGWIIVARATAGGHEAARARPRWRPRAYDIVVAPEARYRLRGNVITGSWTLRGGGGRVAKLNHSRRSAAAIVTFETALADHPLALLVALVLEIERLEASMPAMGDAGGGGG